MLSHIWWANVGVGFSVCEFDGAVNAAFGVDEDLDFFEWDVEEAVSFYKFEAFVEECGGFDGDFLTHLIFRVSKDFFESDVLEFLGGFS